MDNYLTINGVDFSKYVSGIKVQKQTKFNQQTNAAGNTVIDFINCKYVVEVAFTPIIGETEINNFNMAFTSDNGLVVSLGFYNPFTTSISTISASNGNKTLEWYNLSSKQITKPFTLTFTQL